MKKILLLLVLCGLAYGAWWYVKDGRSEQGEASTMSKEEHGVQAKPEMFFSCDGGKEIRVRFMGEQAMVALDTRGFTLTKNAEGVYTQDAITLALTEGGVRVTDSGVETYTICVVVSLARPTIQTYQNAASGLTFYYPSLYYLREREVGTQKKPQTSLVLVEDTQVNRDLLDGKTVEAREGPTSITVDIYHNQNGLSASEWAKNDTNWNLGSKKTKSVMVGGREGVSFDWDGLYKGKSAVVTVGKRVYVFSVTSMDPGDRILIDYEAVLKSAVFSE